MALLVAISLAILSVNAPAFQPVPDRDSGGFMYIGQQMLTGQRLYADLYDDKPPMIFLTNALGLWISGGSAWGVWSLEIVSLCAAVIIALELLAPAVGLWPAFFAVLAFLGNLLAFLLGGNFTEEYALPFQFLILFLVFPRDLERPLTWRAFFAGVALGFVFYFRQNIIGIGIAVGGLLLVGLADWQAQRWKAALWYAAGFLALTAAVVFFFLIHGTLWDFWDATFLSNFAYIGPANVHIPLSTAISNTLTRMLHSGPFFVIALVLWMAFCQVFVLFGVISVRDKIRWPLWLGAYRLFGLLLVLGILIAGMSVFDRAVLGPQFPHLRMIKLAGILVGIELGLLGLAQIGQPMGERIKSWVLISFPSRARMLLLIVLIAFPLDILSISLSGKGFTHYYLTIFPAAVVLLALGAAAIFKLVDLTTYRMYGRVLLGLGLLGVALLPLRNLQNVYQVKRVPQRESVIAFIQANTQPGDRVLAWGSEPVLNYLSGRTTPVRFVFMSQPFLAGYATERFAGEILDELKSTPPKLIVDSRDCKIPFIDDPANACTSVSDQWGPVYQYIQENYRLAAQLGSGKWGVYEIVH